MAKILVVDDEAPIAELLQFVLKRGGHDISVAVNGAEALEQLGVDPADPSIALPDLIVLDVMMPVMDGFTAAISIRNDPRTKDIPLIIVTAKTQSRVQFEAIPSVKAFFHKPFDPNQLRKKIAEVLEGK